MESKLHKKIILYSLLAVGILGVIIGVVYVCFKWRNSKKEGNVENLSNNENDEGKTGTQIFKDL